MKRDKYRNFAELGRAEREGIDFQIRLRAGISPVAVIAPHGGKIEPGTSELAEAIAGGDFSYYCFEGIKPTNNGELHITSTDFDEPRGAALVAAADRVVALHGFSGQAGERLVYLGGLDRALQGNIAQALGGSGFKTLNEGRAHLGGLSLRNIVNRGRRGGGAQLEISRTLRDELMRTRTATESGLFPKFVAAVRQAIMATVAH